MSHSGYNFGVEIETVVRPYARRPEFTRDTQWYEQLAQRLKNRNVLATFDAQGRYVMHPDYHSSQWFITRDSSLERRHNEFVAMEIVSPVLTTTDGITKILSEFWEAMSVGFEVQKEKSCGGHVHVTPARRDKCFTLAELQTCAFATIVAEHMVHSILSASRRDNKYCTVNSRCAGGGWARTAAGGVTKASIKNARMLILRTSTKASLRAYMQNPEKVGRYVLWNFANITPQQGGSSCTGTVEFRGGSQFLNPKTTLKWIAFVVAFIQLALDENLLHAPDFTFVPTNDPNFDSHMAAWWKRIRKSALKLKVQRYLPAIWKEMRV